MAWGINPNLIETYPDIVTYLYETATENDYFTADASAAGYMNPNRVSKNICRYLWSITDVLSRDRHDDRTDGPGLGSAAGDVKDAFVQFAPDGFATIVMDLHGTGGSIPSRMSGRECRSRR